MGKTKYKNVRAITSGSIEITFYYPNKETRQRERIQLQPTATNLERAYRHLGDINEAIKLGTFDYSQTFPNSPRARKYQNNRLLATYMRNWLEEYRNDFHDATYITYKRIIDNQLGFLGRMRMEAITWGDIVKWVRKQKVTQKTANNKLSPIRKAFSVALDDGEIAQSPFAGKHTPKVKRHKRINVDEIKEDEIDPFDRNEVDAIINACSYKQDKYLIQFNFASGLRPSELIALEWRQVDLVNKTVKINRKRTIHSKTPEPTKTKASNRTVKLNAMALDALYKMKQYTYLSGKEVFVNPRTTKPWCGDVGIRQNMWVSVLKKAGVRYRYPYQMRHTYASTSLQLGESVYFVAAQLGHTDPSFTMKTYNRFIPANNPDAGEKFDQFFDKYTEIKAGKKLAK